MLTYIAIGSALAFTAAIQPGPSQAYIFSQVNAVGWRRTLPAALAPLLSDGPIAVLALFVLGQLSPMTQASLRLAGGMLLFFFAWRTFQQWQRNDAVTPGANGDTPRTLWEATMVQFLNPNPYMGWALILGPIVVGAWQEAPSAGIAVVIAFYITLVTMLAVTIYAFGTARLLGPRFRRALLLASALILAGLALYQTVLGIDGLIGKEAVLQLGLLKRLHL